MTRVLPTVTAGLLQSPDAACTSQIAVGSAAWFAWLDATTTQSFAYRGETGRFTARKEARQRGAVYWSAYRSIAGKVRKAYLGASAVLTPEHLAATAAALTPPPALPSAVPALPATPLADRLVQTKLFVPPPRRERVERTRLFEHLAEGLRGKLTTVIAPAGSGKTTLLSAWHADQALPRVPLAWLALDAADNDPSRFWRYVCAALDAVAPGTGTTTIGLLEASQQPTSNQVLLITLLNALAALSHDLVLVLDDFHSITDPTIHQDLTFLIDHLPASVHLVILSRLDPPLPLARLRARGDLVEVRASDLRFTTAEATTLLNTHLQLGLTLDQLVALTTRTEGWAVGLQLAALALRRQEPAARAAFLVAFSGSHRFVGDYLLEEVLQELPRATQEFLISTALCDRLCGPLCDALLPPLVGQPDGQTRLDELERTQLFLVPLDEAGYWYRQHHLLADLLRHRLRQQHPTRIPELHRRASAWFAAAGHHTEAIDHALAAGDYVVAADLLEQVVFPATMLSEHATVQRWVQMLPPDLVYDRPPLALAVGWSYVLQRQAHEAAAHLERLERDPRYAPYAGDIATLWSLSLILRDVPRCIAYGEQALALLRPDQFFQRSSASVSLGVAYWLGGDLVNAERVLSLTIALHEPLLAQLTAASPTGQLPVEQAAQLVPLVISLQTIGDIRRVQGRLPDAERYFARTVELVGGATGPLLPIFSACYAAAYLGALYTEWHHLPAAARYMELALAPLQQAVAGVLGWSVHSYQAFVAQARGEQAVAAAALHRATELAGQSGQPYPLLLCAMFRLRFCLIAGDRAQLDQERTALVALLAQVGVPADQLTQPPHLPGYIWEQIVIVLAWANLACDQPDELLRRTAAMLSTAEAAAHWGHVIPALALSALAQARRGDEAAALAALERSLTLAAPSGYLRTYLDFGPAMQELLQRLLLRVRRERRATAAAPLLAYAERLLAAFPAAALPNRDSHPAPILPEALSTREREILALMAEGFSNPEIATHLFVASGTVKWHSANLFGKLAVTSRTQAIARARALGLIS